MLEQLSDKQTRLERKRFMLFSVAITLLIVGWHFQYVYTLFDVYMVCVGVVALMFCTVFFGMVSIK